MGELIMLREKSVRDHINDEFNKTGRYYNELPFVRKSQDPEAWAAYNMREGVIHRNFRNDLEREFGTDIYPEKVRNKIFYKAWEDGHAYGHSEVLNHYDDLVDFVEQIITGLEQGE